MVGKMTSDDRERSLHVYMTTSDGFCAAQWDPLDSMHW